MGRAPPASTRCASTCRRSRHARSRSGRRPRPPLGPGAGTVGSIPADRRAWRDWPPPGSGSTVCVAPRGSVTKPAPSSRDTVLRNAVRRPLRRTRRNRAGRNRRAGQPVLIGRRRRGDWLSGTGDQRPGSAVRSPRKVIPTSHRDHGVEADMRAYPSTVRQPPHFGAGAYRFHPVPCPVSISRWDVFGRRKARGEVSNVASARCRRRFSAGRYTQATVREG